MQQRLLRTAVAATIGAALLLGSTRDAHAYSVLAHEAHVDALWTGGIRPLLQRRFPGATRAQIDNARAYAYGGSIIQDLGYYPFGNHFFSNLLHYVRSGDFVGALIRDAENVDEYAFALGALAHYTSDTIGHPEAVNRSVPIVFPKLRAKYGDAVTYVESPSSHVIVEFSFDVVQVAAGVYLSDAYHAFIGFKVARPLLARVFRETYALDMREVLQDEDLAISTYRRAVSELIPELTRVAWRDKEEEIARLTPAVDERAFVYAYSRHDFEREFGTAYRKPSVLARLVGFVYRLVPKIGPLKPLRFKAPTPGAEALFARSFTDARVRYAAALDGLARGRLDVPNTDFDTGRPAAHGEYALADDTYAELLDRLARHKFAAVTAALRADISGFYARGSIATINRRERKRLEKLDVRLAEMNAAARSR